jgi:hypothetical protein
MLRCRISASVTMPPCSVIGGFSGRCGQQHTSCVVDSWSVPTPAEHNTCMPRPVPAADPELSAPPQPPSACAAGPGGGGVICLLAACLQNQQHRPWRLPRTIPVPPLGHVALCIHGRVRCSAPRSHQPHLSAHRQLPRLAGQPFSPSSAAAAGLEGHLHLGHGTLCTVLMP